jgi:glycosyltransferase involved in cell wall biosynthesis
MGEPSATLPASPLAEQATLAASPTTGFDMKIAYITAGAAGMYCGSCMHDNTLVAALRAQGHDALLIPTYTPIRTDETDVSQQRVFFGGINVYLQQHSALFRRTPWFLDRLLDFSWLLRWVSRFAVKTQAQELGELTVSMLKGEHGLQKKEFEKLVQWLSADVQPQIINLTNVLLSGMVHEVKAHSKTRLPILGTLQGDDIFLEFLPEKYRLPALELLYKNCQEFDGFIATSHYYADFMAKYLRIPREKIDVVHPGLNLTGYGKPLGEAPRTVGVTRKLVVGYFARICPEKGLHVLVDAMQLLKQMPGAPTCRLKVAGWLGENNRAYFDDLVAKIRSWGWHDDFEHINCPDHASKVAFLQSLDVLSVPTTYREPKGLYVLEALANGVPVVQPNHGSFPELIEATGGGLLCNPEDPAHLAQVLRQILEQPELRGQLGATGYAAVHDRFHAAAMAERTIDVYRKYLS